MKKRGYAVKSTSSASSGAFVERVTGRITPAEYVRAIDSRVSERRKDEQQHRRSK